MDTPTVTIGQATHDPRVKIYGAVMDIMVKAPYLFDEHVDQLQHLLTNLEDEVRNDKHLEDDEATAGINLIIAVHRYIETQRDPFGDCCRWLSGNENGHT